MKKLEKQIIKNVYLFETKQTIFLMVVLTLIISLGSYLIYLFAGAIVTSFLEQQTLDLILIFTDNFFEAISQIEGIVIGLYHESPKLLLLLLLSMVVLVAYTSSYLIKKRGKLTKKMKSLTAFWLSRS